MTGNSPIPLIVYFDGYCNLCNGFIDFLVRVDRHQSLRYAPLQGETARTRGIHDPARDPVPGSVVVVDAGETLTESDAVIRIFGHLGGVWVLVSGLKIVPKFIRDGVYRSVARNRYRIFGRRDTCRVPSPGEKSLFLP